MCIFITVLLVLVTFLMTLVNRVLVSETYTINTCGNDACEAYAALLHYSMNLSADPCQDFYAFVCGNYSRSHALSVQQEAFEEFLRAVTATAASMRVNHTHQAAVEKAARFYQTCEHALYETHGELDHIIRVLAEAGIVWPNKALRPDILSTMFDLSSRWFWETFICIEWTTFDGKPQITVDPSWHFQALLRHRKIIIGRGKYFYYFSVLYDAFGSANGSAESDYAELTSIESVAVPLFEAALLGPKLKVQTTVAKFDLAEPEIHRGRWFQCFREYFGNRAISDTPVLVGHRMFIEILGTLLKNLGEDKLHVYLSWCVVQQMALLANDRLIVNYYDSWEEAKRSHKAFCFHLVQEWMGFALLSSYATEVAAPRVQDEVGRIVHHIRDIFDETLSGNGLGSSDFTATRGDARNDSVIAFLRKFFKDSVEVAFADYPGMTSSLVENYRLSVSGFKTTSQPEAICRPCFRSPPDATPLALVENKDIVLSPCTLALPFYDIGVPVSVKYGSLGSFVAGALMRLFVTTYSSSQNQSHFNDTVGCFFGNDTDINEDPDLSSLNAEVFVASAAVDILWRALGSSARKNIIQWLKPEKLFFIAWCYVLCDVVDSQSSQLCNAALQHTPQFASTFECSENSAMFQKDACRLFPN